MRCVIYLRITWIKIWEFGTVPAQGQAGCDARRTECFTSFNIILPNPFRSSWKNLPPNFFGKKDESKQKKKEEVGPDRSRGKLTYALKYIQFSREYTYHFLFITTSLGPMKVQCTKTFYTQLHKLEAENISHTDHDFSLNDGFKTIQCYIYILLI